MAVCVYPAGPVEQASLGQLSCSVSSNLTGWAASVCRQVERELWLGAERLSLDPRSHQTSCGPGRARPALSPVLGKVVA